MAEPQPEVVEHLKALYASYRHAPNMDAIKDHYAPNCAQICRTEPAYAAQDRDTIVRYLLEAKEKFKDLLITSPDKKSRYSIRALKGEEAADFGAEEHVRPAGFSSVEELRAIAQQDGWVGMRADLWDVDEQGNGMLVKVHYWWGKQDDGEWKQVLHDILYIGKLDGSEGSQGPALE